MCLCIQGYSFVIQFGFCLSIIVEKREELSVTPTTRSSEPAAKANQIGTGEHHLQAGKCPLHSFTMFVEGGW